MSPGDRNPDGMASQFRNRLQTKGFSVRWAIAILYDVAARNVYDSRQSVDARMTGVSLDAQVWFSRRRPAPMKRVVLVGALGSILAVASVASAAISDPVKIEAGQLSGASTATPSVRVFKGIPFAAPPTGENRWRAPQPAAKWDGVRAANAFGAPCTAGAVVGGAVVAGAVEAHRVRQVQRRLRAQFREPREPRQDEVVAAHPPPVRRVRPQQRRTRPL